MDLHIPANFWYLLGVGIFILCVGKAYAMIVLTLRQRQPVARSIHAVPSVPKTPTPEENLLHRLSQATGASTFSSSSERTPPSGPPRAPLKIEVPVSAVDLPRPRRKHDAGKSEKRVRDSREG